MLRSDALRDTGNWRSVQCIIHTINALHRWILHESWILRYALSGPIVVCHAGWAATFAVNCICALHRQSQVGMNLIFWIELLFNSRHPPSFVELFHQECVAQWERSRKFDEIHWSRQEQAIQDRPQPFRTVNAGLGMMMNVEMTGYKWWYKLWWFH